MTTGKMLQYVEVDVPRVRFTTFGAVAEGVQPSDWTNLWTADTTLTGVEDTEFPSGRGVRFAIGAGARRAWGYNPAAGLADVSVIALVKYGTSNSQPYIIVRASGGIATEQGYRFGFRTDLGLLEIGKFTAGTFSQLATLAFVPVIGDYYWLLFDVFSTSTGVTLRGKVWQGELSDEPSEFTLFFLDTSDFPAGAVGLNGNGLNSTYDIGFFHVSTFGEEEDTYRFATPSDYLPADIEAIPSLRSVNYNAAAVSLGDDLGRRATASIQFRDHPHTFSDEPFGVGTFWGKWRATFGQTLRGRGVRLIQGFLGQALASMETRHLIVENTNGPTPDGSFEITARDPIKFLDDMRAQAPLLSNGRLAGAIDDNDTAILLTPTGIGDAEYPASGVGCIGGKEVVTFTRSGDSVTIVRAQLGTNPIAHATGDRFQLVLYYAGNTMAEIVFDLLENYTDFNTDNIPLADWEAEMDAYLPVLYSRPITEPTGVNKLISELISQSATALAWDDRASLLRLQVLREISTDAEVIPEERIIAGSLKVTDQPDTRISRHWTYFGQRNPTDRGDNSDNYRAALEEVDLERETIYGSAEIRKIFGSWVPTLAAADRLNQIKMSRFRDPPRKFSFDLFQGHILQILGGYRLSWMANQDLLGNAVQNGAPIQVTKISVEPGLVHIEAEEMLASGVINLINVVILTTTGGVLEWEVPGDWDDLNNSIHCIGGGGSGAGSSGDGDSGGGGGAGAYSSIVNLNLTPGANIQYRIGAGGATVGGFANGNPGEDTWFNGANLAASSVGAKGGTGGISDGAGGTGGLASAGVGTTKTSGGDGGSGGQEGGAGGGGAAGPNGDGADGSSGDRSENGGGGGGADGGSAGAITDGGDNRFGFGGGTTSAPIGQDGGGGSGAPGGGPGPGIGGAGEQIWTQTIAPIISAGPGGGGGGGNGQFFTTGAAGGLYGGGGGGGGEDSGGGGAGAQGVIVIIWAATVEEES